MTTFGGDEGVPLPVSTSGQSILLARSYDDGKTWELKPVFEPPQSVAVGLIGFATSIFPVVAADQNGTLYVVFSVDQQFLPATTPKPAARFGVYMMVSHDQGDTWSEPLLLSDPDHVALMPFIAAGAAGRVAVTWYENTYGLPSDFLSDLWNVKMWESITADQAAPTGLTVQLNGEPNHIGAVCTAGTGCLAGDRSMLDFFEVVISPDGQPKATWAYTVLGTGIGVAVVGPDIYAGGVADGTPLL